MGRGRVGCSKQTRRSYLEVLITSRGQLPLSNPRYFKYFFFFGLERAILLARKRQRAGDGLPETDGRRDPRQEEEKK